MTLGSDTIACDKCGAEVSQWLTVRTARQTHYSPADYEHWCRRCAGVDDGERDEAYERANIKYGESGNGGL